jgi:hypothetical protein
MKIDIIWNFSTLHEFAIWSEGNTFLTAAVKTKDKKIVNKILFAKERGLDIDRPNRAGVLSSLPRRECRSHWTTMTGSSSRSLRTVEQGSHLTPHRPKLFQSIADAKLRQETMPDLLFQSLIMIEGSADQPVRHVRKNMSISAS